MSSRSTKRTSIARDGWGYPLSAQPMTWPLKCVDAGFLALIVLLPFIWGGRQALGHFAVILMSAWLAFWWAVHQLRQDRPRWRFSGAEPLFVMGILLVILQTISLSEPLKDTLSPQMDRLLPAWSDDPETSIGQGNWSTLSFAPWQTWSDLVTLVAVMLVFFVAVQRLETFRDIHRLMHYVAISGCLTAVFGVIQYVFSNGMFYWVYEHPDTDPSGAAKAAFTNANHFANFLAMSLPAQLWWFVKASRSIQKRREARDMNNPAPTGWRGFFEEWTPAIMMIVTSMAVVLSQSRGGIVVACVGVLVTSLLFWRQGFLDSRVFVGYLGIAVIGGMAMMMYGGRLEKKLTADIDSMTSGSGWNIDRQGSRQKIWSTDLKVARDFPWAGTGLGTHRYVYESYHDYPATGVEYTHAENSYLQIAMETGVTGLTISGLLIAMVAYWCVRGLVRGTGLDVRGPLTVALAVLLVNILHACTDFVWYVSSCMVLVMLFAASACVLYRLSGVHIERTRNEVTRLGRLGWTVMLVFVLLGTFWGVRLKWPEVAAEPDYLEYRRLANSQKSHDDPSGTRFEIAAILRAVRANPHDPILQIRAGRAHLRTFLLEHAQDHELHLEDLRQAALSSGYTKREELYAWLDIPEVMGKSRQHLHRAQVAYSQAMRLCPLEPRPYIESAKLAWLSLAPSQVEDRLLQQAITARPYEGQVWLEYAHALSNSGRIEEALPCYQKAFERDARCRQAIIADLSPHYSPNFFLTSFELDRETLAHLKTAFEGTNDKRGYRNILQLLAEAEMAAAGATYGDESATHVIAAHQCYVEMEEELLATTTLRGAIKRHGNSFKVRSTFAYWLFDHGQYSEALPHLEWCHRRRPDIPSIGRRIEVALSRSDKPTTLAEEPQIDSQLR